jgi:hypothetical protein
MADCGQEVMQRAADLVLFAELFTVSRFEADSVDASMHGHRDETALSAIFQKM